MILADTSIWVDHLRDGDPAMAAALGADTILMHPYVFGEIALGYLDPREEILNRLDELPGATVAADNEVVELIDRQRLFGTGIGYVDAHLLAATLLTPGAKLWTRDRRLRAAAEELAIAADG